MKTFENLDARGDLGEIGNLCFLGILYLLEALWALVDMRACCYVILLEYGPVPDNLESGEMIRKAPQPPGLNHQVFPAFAPDFLCTRDHMEWVTHPFCLPASMFLCL